MAKVNYQFQKAERERAKLAKKEAKRREEHARTEPSAEPNATPDAPQAETPSES